MKACFIVLKFGCWIFRPYELNLPKDNKRPRVSIFRHLFVSLLGFFNCLIFFLKSGLTLIFIRLGLLIVKKFLHLLRPQSVISYEVSDDEGLWKYSGDLDVKILFSKLMYSWHREINYCFLSLAQYIVYSLHMCLIPTILVIL